MQRLEMKYKDVGSSYLFIAKYLSNK